jgi:integrase
LIEANPVLATNTHCTTKSRDRVLSSTELVEVWRASGNGAYGAVVKLLMLTGQRRNEIGSLRWSEIDLAAGLIQLPSERSKDHLSHDVPLSEPAMQLLQAMSRQGAFVFGTSSIGFCDYHTAKTALDQRIAGARQWRASSPAPVGAS